MALALVAGGSATEISPGRSITLGEGKDAIHVSYASLEKWSADELAAVRVYEIAETAIPEGKVSTGSTLIVEGNVVTRAQTLVDRPAPPVPDCTPAQAIAELTERGLIEQVEAIVTAHPYPLVQVYWRRASIFEFSNAYIQGIGMEMNLDLEALFRAAAARVF